MFGKMINIPFKVLVGVAREVQAQEAKKWTDLAERDATAARESHSMDIAVPADFNPGPIEITPKIIKRLRESGCILDTAPSPTIDGALHIPLNDIGIGIAEVPADVCVGVVAENPLDARRVVRFLRHRGLDDTWVIAGDLSWWNADNSVPK